MSVFRRVKFFFFCGEDFYYAYDCTLEHVVLRCTGTIKVTSLTNDIRMSKVATDVVEPLFIIGRRFSRWLTSIIKKK